MVFVMAAVIAITLYIEMPRVAFESQRAKEQLLVDRGNEYKRAIQLFYRKMKRFPAKIEDLESTSNIRFLRRRYQRPYDRKRGMAAGPCWTGRVSHRLAGAKAEPARQRSKGPVGGEQFAG